MVKPTSETKFSRRTTNQENFYSSDHKQGWRVGAQSAHIDDHGFTHCFPQAHRDLS